MVKYYFENKDRQKKLNIILDEWLNTPFRHYCGVKGLGCDCIHFVAKVFEELKLIDLTRIKVPNYPKDWHLHNTRELLEESILKYLDVDIININDKLINGDIILSHYGKAASHSGIYFNKYIYQAINKIGVKKIHFSDKKFKKQMKYAYRVKE